MNSPTPKSWYWLRLLLHVDSKYSVSFNQIWIWIIFSDWFANIEAFCSDRAISWIAWCQMSFVNAFYWSYCERFNHAPFIFFYNIFFTLIVFNQWQTSVIQTSDSYILDFPNHLGQSNPPIYHKRLLNFDFATHTATANTLIYFRFVVDACSELNLRQANCLSSIFYLKFRFDTQ